MDATETRFQTSSFSPRSHGLWIVAIWAALGLFDATQTVFVMRSEGMHHDWWRLFAVLAISWTPWAIGTPLVLRLGRRLPLTYRMSLLPWAAHLGLLTAISLAFTAWGAALERWFNPYVVGQNSSSFIANWSAKFWNGLLSSIVLYAFILAIQHLLDSRDRLARQQTETARLNEQLSQAQLNALRRQIEPHFLFNALNSIAGLVREGRNDAAVTMIAGLSDCLRSAMADSNCQEFSLGEELDFVNKYLQIQKVRFADRLRVEVDVAPDLLRAQVPSLILQPMIENAIKHGIAKRVQGGTIRIAGSRCNGSLTLSVWNDGPSLPAGWEQTRSGIGLSNARSRLRRLYGERFEFDLRNQNPVGVEASISVPYIERPVEAARLASNDSAANTDVLLTLS